MNLLIKKAQVFATLVHVDQLYNGKPFARHPLQVADVIKVVCPEDVNLQVAAILHDTIEDGGITKEELAQEFNQDVANLVWEVTKTGSNTFGNLKSLRATILKLADRTANYANAEKRNDPKWLKQYMKKVFWK